MIIFLDTWVLGLLTNPNEDEESESRKCTEWFYKVLSRTASVCSSDICDYEVRRGLIEARIRVGGGNGIYLLDDLRQDNQNFFMRVTPEVLFEAAQLWAEARLKGTPTSDRKNIDVDMIISAHFKELKATNPGREIIVATDNHKHLSLFTDSMNWQDINF